MTKTFNIEKLVRKNIKDLKPYSSARDEFKGTADVYLDANENPYPSPYNRYPDPLQLELKGKLSRIKSVETKNIFLGNGSDEAIDLLIRAFCEPNQDSILITEPTYGMYAVCADVNAVSTQRVPLTRAFDVDVASIFKTADASTKIIFLCSPNNPTGNLLDKKNVIEILDRFDGLVVIDEAYIDFSSEPSFTGYLSSYPNLVILQTFSKAWGLAGLRLGMCFADRAIIDILNKIKYPYNISIETQRLALDALNNEHQKNEWVTEILIQREVLASSLSNLQLVRKVYPTDANFILAEVADAPGTYKYLMNQGIIVRDRSRVLLCDNCLRITVGTPDENKSLLNALSNLTDTK